MIDEEQTIIPNENIRRMRTHKIFAFFLVCNLYIIFMCFFEDFLKNQFDMAFGCNITNKWDDILYNPQPTAIKCALKCDKYNGSFQSNLYMKIFSGLSSLQNLLLDMCFFIFDLIGSFSCIF